MSVKPNPNTNLNWSYPSCVLMNNDNTPNPHPHPTGSQGAFPPRRPQNGFLGSAQPWQQCDCLRLWRWAGPTCICQCRLTPALTSARPDCSRSWHAAMPRCHLHAAMPRCHLHAAMPLACCDATGMLRCAPAYLLIKSNTLPRCSWPGAGGEYRAIWRFWQAWPQSSHR